MSENPYKVEIQASNDSVERARLLLAGISGGVKKALGSAINRTATSAEALAAKEIHAEYFVSSKEFKDKTKVKPHVTQDGTQTVLAIEFYGQKIPLIQFDTKFGKDGRVTTRVKRSSARETLDHAFFAQIGGRLGVFERLTDAREPTRELLGPTTTQMMSYNDGLKEKIGEKIRDTFQERMDHEVDAILNGWRQ